MITENSWAVTKAEIDRVVSQAHTDRARYIRAKTVAYTASIKRFFAGFRSQTTRKSAAV